MIYNFGVGEYQLELVQEFRQFVNLFTIIYNKTFISKCFEQNKVIAYFTVNSFRSSF